MIVSVVFINPSPATPDILEWPSFVVVAVSVYPGWPTPCKVIPEDVPLRTLVIATSVVWPPATAVEVYLILQSYIASVPLTSWLNVILVAVVFMCAAVNSGALAEYASWIKNPDPDTSKDTIAITEKVNFEDSVMKKITNEEL